MKRIEALLAIVGENFDTPSEICGAVASVRARGDRVAVWTKTASERSVQEHIGRQLKEICGLQPEERIGYLIHHDAGNSKNPHKTALLNHLAFDTPDPVSLAFQITAFISAAFLIGDRMVAANGSHADSTTDWASEAHLDEQDARASVFVAGSSGDAKASLLVGWNLEGKTVIVVGSSDLSASRASVALAAHPKLLRIVTGGSEPSSAVRALVGSAKERHPHVIVSVESRHLLPNVDLVYPTALVLCAVDESATARRVASLCSQRGIPVNVAGHPDLSTFRVIGGVQDGAVQIGFTGNGVGGTGIIEKVRSALEKHLPQGLGKAAENVDRLREILSTHSSDPSRVEIHLASLVAKSSLHSLAVLSDAEMNAAAHAFARGEDAEGFRGLEDNDDATETGSDAGFEANGKYGTSSVRNPVQIVRVAAWETDAGRVPKEVYEAIVDAELVIAPSTLPSVYHHIVSGDVFSVRSWRSQSARSAALGASSRGLKVTWIIVDDEDVDVDEVKRWFATQGTGIKLIGCQEHNGVAQAAEAIAIRTGSRASTASSAIHVAPPTAHKSTIHRQGVRTIATTSSVVEHVATLLSDVVVIAGSPRPMQPTNISNIHGLPTTVISLPTRTSSGTAIHGMASAGSAVAALVSDQSLPYMIEGIVGMIRGGNPGVVHVEAKGVDQGFDVKARFSGVWEGAAVGAAVLVGTTAEEVHDMAIAAHLASHKSRIPFINVFDGAFLASSKSVLLTLSKSDLAGIENHFQNTHSGVSGPLVAATAAFGVLERFSGKKYQPFEYNGHPQPSLVVVALSTDSAVFESAVHKLVRQGQKVGLICVRLASPWSIEHFATVLPHSVERVAVVDPSRVARDVGAAQGYVFAHVVSAIQERKAVRAFDIKVETSIQLTPGVAEKVLSIVGKAATHFKTIVIDTEIAASLEVAAYASQTLRQAVLFDLAANGSTVVADRAVREFYGAGLDTIAMHTSYDALVPEPAVRTDIRFGQGDAPSHVSDFADYVAFHQASLLARYNGVASLKPNGVVLVNTPWSSIEELEKELSEEVKKSLSAKSAQLYLVDVEKLAHVFTQFVGDKKEYAHIILEGLFYHFATQTPNANVEALVARIHGSFQHFGVRRSLIRAVRKAIKIAHKIPIPTTWGRLHAHRLLPVIPSSVPIGVAAPAVDYFSPKVSKSHTAGWKLVFPEAYDVQHALRPDTGDATLATVSERLRVTPDSYDRNIFHMEIDIAGTGMTYNGLGEALGVYAHNDDQEVSDFLRWYGIDPHELVDVGLKTKEGNVLLESRTAEHVFGQVTDIFGKPGKSFYKNLAVFAKDLSQRNKLLWIGSSDGSHEFDRRAEQTVTYADILHEFTSARPTFSQLVQLIPPMKPRAYSIASAASMHPTKVHLLIVLVDWTDAFGRKRQGQATRYLSSIKPGQKIAVTIKPSIMKLPPLSTAPVVMSGLGTGMAPFRTFIQARAMQKQAKQSIGPMSLYFGARHRSQEYLYGEEMDAWHDDDILTHLRLAFSRDQKDKVYIQHKMYEDAAALFDLLVKQKGSFYLCGPVWPVPDVTEAILRAFEHGGLTRSQAENLLEEMKEEERFVLEVY
ncbi:hypothetical protein HDU93_001716 [Gonapodya sp. JEL0774]|nr:hypothetical protein HDU93_001716 [Gonapodya sp. JEL0774]